MAYATHFKMDALNKGSVHIKNREKVERMITEIIEDGKDRLQVIADWDFTLTRFASEGGKRCDSCHNALDESHLLPEDYRTKAVEVRNTYYPIEIDPRLTITEKYPYMVEWWTKSHDLLLQCNLTRETLREIVAESTITLRDGVTWTFEELHKASVPLLIFSAGLGDVIEEVIRRQTHIKIYDNMKIVSNYLDFNSHGTLVGFRGELIHVFNKNEAAIHKSEYFEKLRHRDNVLLLGDSLGDLRMAEGCTNCKHMLKIGFLNEKVSERLDTYLDAFDIVIVSDETMDVPNAILQQLL